MHRPDTRASRRRAVLAGLLGATLLAGGCAVREPVELPPEPTADAPAAAPVPAPFAFPQTCSDLVDPEVLSDVVAAGFTGESRRVYAGPVESVGRTQRLTCSYGVPADPDSETPPAIQLTLNEYVDAATAEQRLEVTVDAARTGGQQVTEAPINGLAGYHLRDDRTASAVVAADDRTVVASIRRGLVPAAAETVVLDGLVAAMLRLPLPEALPGGTDDSTDPWGATPTP